MVGVVVEPKFIRTRLDPGSVLGAFRAAGEKLLAPSAANVNVARIVAAGVPSDRRLDPFLTHPGSGWDPREGLLRRRSIRQWDDRNW